MMVGTATLRQRCPRRIRHLPDNQMGSRDGYRANAARGLGWLLRAEHDGVIREPLPARWVELINCMDEKERARLKLELSLGPELSLSDDDTSPLLKS